MASTDIQGVRERIDIVDLIGSDVRLLKAGKRFKALCPFHSEKTPSFSVDPERQSWHCFGSCAEGGDAFSYVMKRDHLEFGEALRLLAERAGVTLDERGREQAETNARLFAANEAAAAFFQQALRGSSAGAEARTYSEKRGLDAATLDASEIGYAPDGWDALKEYLTGKGFDEETLLDAGLLIRNEERSSVYDRFRRRLIFPIRDDRGRAVGFGGRALDDAKPKYLNTPQTPVFDKGALLFLLDRAKETVRAAGEAVIVEGYLDAITAHQFGYKNVVATLGTALTERHIALLKRFTPRVTLAMDADAAGVQAALRGEEVARAAAGEGGRAEAVVGWEGLVRAQTRAPVEVRVFSVPSGKDPDEAIREQPQGWPGWVAAALPPFEFRLRAELAAVEPRDQRARLAIADRMLPLLLQVSDPATQAAYLGQLARVASTDERSLAARLRALTNRQDAGAPLRERQRLRDERPAPQPAAAPRGDDKLEAFALALLLRHPDLREAGLALSPDLFASEAHRQLFARWFDGATALPDELRPLQERLLAAPLPPLVAGEAERALLDTVEKLQLRLLTARRRLWTAELAELGEPEDAAAQIASALRLLGGADVENVSEGARTLAARLRDDEELMKTVHALEWESRTHRAAPWTAARSV